MVLNVFLALLGAFVAWAGNSDELKLFLNEEMANDPDLNISPDDLQLVLDGMGAFGWALAAAGVIGIIFGIIAVVKAKGNKSPKTAGWLLIIGAVLTGAISIGFGFLPALLYLIAGIMCFVRKEPAGE
jgi:hypothetical protein